MSNWAIVREWPNSFPVKCEMACFYPRESLFH